MELRFADVSSMSAETLRARSDGCALSGFTIAGLASRVLVTEATIRIETGDSKDSSFSVGVRLADALSLDVRYLAFREDTSLAPSAQAITPTRITWSRGEFHC